MCAPYNKNKPMLRKIIENKLLFNFECSFREENNLKLLDLVKIKKLNTTAYKVRVPGHKNQKQLILKKSNHPNFDGIPKTLDCLKI